MIPRDTKQKVLNDIQDKYGKDLLDLEKCTQVYESLLEQKKAIEKELNPLNYDGLIGASIKEAKSTAHQSNIAVRQTKEVIFSIENDLNELDEVRTNLKSSFDKLNTLQSTLQYMRVVQQIEYLCEELWREVSKQDDEKCTTLFANLTEICRILSDCPVMHLKNYLKECILYWHDILKAKLSKDFDEVLKQMKWPFLSANFSLVTPIESNVAKIQIIAEYLLQIEIPHETNIPVEVPSGVLSDFTPLCLPIHLLVQPLRKRFIYHFYGNRKTNRLDKPEWYFTQILTWVRDHKDHVGIWIQPVIDKFGLHHLDARNEFIRGLVQLAAEKLNTDLPSLQFDDFTFSHSIDEALGFDKELREIYMYPTTQACIIVVLTQAQVLIKWLIMEKKYATEKMDVILSPNSMEAFDLLPSDLEDLKITTCADAFITLLQTITERYECLPQPGHRLQFLELQLELLDDFRVRSKLFQNADRFLPPYFRICCGYECFLFKAWLSGGRRAAVNTIIIFIFRDFLFHWNRLLQIVNAEVGDAIESKVPMIANTLYYVETVLVDWGAMLHYLTLYYYKNQIEEVKPLSASPSLNGFDNTSLLDLESDSLFADTLSLYRHFRRDLLCGLAETVIMEVKKRSWHYRREKWSSIKLEKEFRSLSLTPSACPIFEVLAKRLHQLQRKLQCKLFTIVWRNIATQLDSYLFEDLVMDNRFNDGGALQLKFDITRNLLPLFSQYTETPAGYFTQLIESCNLLNLTKGSALLLRETLLALEGTTGVEDTRGKTLKEIGVSNFGPKMAVKILNQRTDITVNRLDVD